MDFQGPTRADYENVRALNAAFLGLVRTGKISRPCLAGLAPHFKLRLERLSRREIGWLSAAPFLLFSFRERDDAYWRGILADGESSDLFSVQPADDVVQLVSAGLGFIWQLANRNPFAARLLCGASTHWCEQIVERTFFELLRAASQRGDLIELRAKHDADLWNKLLIGGLAGEFERRHAAQVSALQYMLTHQMTGAVWAAAACAMPDPALEVADHSRQ